MSKVNQILLSIPAVFFSLLFILWVSNIVNGSIGEKLFANPIQFVILGILVHSGILMTIAFVVYYLTGRGLLVKKITLGSLVIILAIVISSRIF